MSDNEKDNNKVIECREKGAQVLYDYIKQYKSNIFRFFTVLMSFYLRQLRRVYCRKLIAVGDQKRNF